MNKFWIVGLPHSVVSIMWKQIKRIIHVNNFTICSDLITIFVFLSFGAPPVSYIGEGNSLGFFLNFILCQRHVPADIAVSTIIGKNAALIEKLINPQRRGHRHAAQTKSAQWMLYNSVESPFLLASDQLKERPPKAAIPFRKLIGSLNIFPTLILLMYGKKERLKAGEAWDQVERWNNMTKNG